MEQVISETRFHSHFGEFVVGQKMPVDRANIRLLSDLSKEVDTRVSMTALHSGRVARWVKPVANNMGLERRVVQATYWAALLHDVGKIGLPDKILTKKGILTDQEWVWMKLHPVVGANLVNTMTPLSDAASLIHFHHEWYNGMGYPTGLRGEDIPLGSRIINVVDAYEAMTSDRVYRSARTHQEAVIELLLQSGKQFDPHVVSAFIKYIDGKQSSRNLPV
jgi:HD-GYP domain-containing protein (c-di-GMP phosphodiesterase class II)